MQQPLSQEEKLIIKNIYRKKSLIANASMVIGIISILAGTLFIMWYDNDTFLLILIIMFFTMGLLALFTGIRRKISNNRLIKTALEIDQNELTTGYLKQVEIINANTLRYHFNGFSKDVNLNTPGALIQPLETLRNINMTLHIVSLPSGEELLLKAMYDKPVFSGEIATPFTAEDKNTLWPIAKSEFRSIAYIVLIIGGFMSLAGFITPWILIVTMGIPIIVIICIFIAGLSSFIRMNNRNKVLLTTRITESVQIWAKSGKYSSRQTWYRLDNGVLQAFGNSNLQVGNIVRFLYIQKKDGSKGLLLGVEKV
jgi:hypothetical protein